jgi:EmrB/QacA subfamily drug resistance transporter
MDLLDSLATTVAAPSIQRELGGSDTLVQWLGAGYTIAMAVGLMTGGRLGDIFGRRRLFTIGASGFVASSLLCGLAQDPSMLIAARVSQGLFGAVMLPQGLGLVREMFGPGTAAKAYSLLGPVIGLASVGGPILAGWLVSANYFGWGWRMIFFINLPIGLFAIIASRRLPAGADDVSLRFDLRSATLASAAAFLLIFPLVQGRAYGWPWWTYVMIAAGVAGVAGFVAFVLLQERHKAAGRDPLVEPSLFHKRTFTLGMATGTVFFAALVGYSLTITLFFQIGLGWSPLKAGLASAPGSVGTMLGFGLFSKQAAPYARRLMVIGGSLFAAGLTTLLLVVRGAGDAPSIAHTAGPIFVAGFGMSLFMLPFSTSCCGLSTRRSSDRRAARSTRSSSSARRSGPRCSGPCFSSSSAPAAAPATSTSTGRRSRRALRSRSCSRSVRSR